MCLGCLVAGLGLAYDSEEAQEFIQQAVGTDGGYTQSVYGQIKVTYKENSDEEHADCDSDCGGFEAESAVEYQQPTLNY